MQELKASDMVFRWLRMVQNLWMWLHLSPWNKNWERNRDMFFFKMLLACYICKIQVDNTLFHLVWAHDDVQSYSRRAAVFSTLSALKCKKKTDFASAEYLSALLQTRSFETDFKQNWLTDKQPGWVCKIRASKSPALCALKDNIFM